MYLLPSLSFWHPIYVTTQFREIKGKWKAKLPFSYWLVVIPQLSLYLLKEGILYKPFCIFQKDDANNIPFTSFFLYLYHLILFLFLKKTFSFHYNPSSYFSFVLPLSFLQTFPKVFLSLQTYFPFDSFSIFSVPPCILPSVTILWSCLSFEGCWLEKPWSKEMFLPLHIFGVSTRPTAHSICISWSKVSPNLRRKWWWLGK